MPIMAESISSLELLEVECGTINFTVTELHLLTVVWTSGIKSSHHMTLKIMKKFTKDSVY